MKLGVIMDPVITLDPEKDTTLGLLDAAQRQGWQLYYLTVSDIWLTNGEAWGDAREIEVRLSHERWFELGDGRHIALSSLDAILLRKDPPVDEAYCALCHILEHVPGRRIFNDPAGICLANEKAAAQRYAALQPPTLIDMAADRIRAFVDQHGDAVIKPFNGMQGWSVFRLCADDVNADVIIEEMTNRGRRAVVVQKLIPEYAQGDKRVLVINGRPAPHALLRVPEQGNLRANLAAGGRAETVEIDARDRAICNELAPWLKDMGLLFVGLDIIGGWLTEINITSPTCMRQIDNMLGTDIGSDVMRAIEAQIA